MKLFITGTPGTGKSTLSLALKEELNYLEIFEIKELLIKFNLLEEYEKERDTTIFDGLLAKNTIQNFLKLKDNYVLVGPVLPFDEIEFTHIIVLTCSLKLVLEERLKKRKYKKSKIEENLEAELLGVILGEVMDDFPDRKDILILDSCKSSIQELVSVIKNLLIK